MENSENFENVRCPACGSAGPFRAFEAKERMLGTMDSFRYLECIACHTLWLKNPPENMGRYYPSDYYSFGDQTSKAGNPASLRNIAKRAVIQKRFGHSSILGGLLQNKFSSYLEWLQPDYFDMNKSVLDLGCGSGFFLASMANAGFRNLKGLDPFNKEAIRLKSGVFIDNKDVFSESGRFHGVMLHHSFEHMDQPLEVLSHIHKILEDDGFLLIRIPIAESSAWAEYGPLWVQLDAPRHYFIHSRKGLENLFSLAGFRLDKVVHDSYSLQYWGSELYKKDMPLSEGTKPFSQTQLSEWTKKAEENNRNGRGDQACFYLRKK